MNILSKIEVPAKYNHESKRTASPTETVFELVENALNPFSGLELTDFHISNNNHNLGDDKTNLNKSI